MSVTTPVDEREEAIQIWLRHHADGEELSGAALAERLGKGERWGRLVKKRAVERLAEREASAAGKPQPDGDGAPVPARGNGTMPVERPAGDAQSFVALRVSAGVAG